MKTIITGLVLGLLLGTSVDGGEHEVLFDGIHAEMGALEGERATMYLTLYGSGNADPRLLVARGDKSAFVEDVDRDGYADVTFLREVEELSDESGDGVPDVITAAGPGGGPHVRVFNAFGGFTGGVRVAVDRDAYINVYFNANDPLN